MAGNPTQFMMERAFEEAGVDARCLTLDVPPEGLAAAFAGMQAMGFRGAVIASPHNAPICSQLDDLTTPARFIERVDCVYRDETERWIGEHTLGAAVVAAVDADLAGKRVVVVGAGPVAQVIGLAFAQRDSVHLVIASVLAEGEAVVERLAAAGTASVEFERISHNVDFEPKADVVIRAEGYSTADDPHTEPLPLPTHFIDQTIAVDLPYRTPRTDFLYSAEQAGSQIVSGVDVLVRRANRAFHAWTGGEASVSILRDAVEEFFMI